jgi:rhamnosyltransferase
MHLAAVTIIYNPSESIIENLLSYYKDVEVLYIIDNSTSENPFILEKLPFSNIIYYHDGNNGGIAKRLNQAAALALSSGFDWMLTMDQDSYFDQGAVSRFVSYIEGYEHKNSTAIFGVNYAEPAIGNSVFKEVPLVITSGSIINLPLLQKMGSFDENLFIDEVDSEYCYRARLSGYKILECAAIYLHHLLGEIKMGRSLKSGTYTFRRLHAPIRLYYMVRNYFYVLHKLPLISVSEKKEMKRGLLVRIKNNLIYNPQRWQVIKYIAKGYLDYSRKKMGKINTN